MNISSYEFTYSPENIRVNFDLFTGNFDINILITTIVCIIAWIFLYYFAPNIIVYFDAKREYLKKLEDKNIIRELILMKEVQSELDNEINESLLNAWLKSAQAST